MWVLSSTVKRVVLCLAAVAMAVCLMLAPRASADTTGNAPASSLISITHTSASGMSQCLPAYLAGSATLIDSAKSYTVKVTTWAPICGTVSAVVYSMPNNIFYPWPQHRVEVKTTTITPGVTTFTFTKQCTPTQFDVVTGQTPATIQPATGPMHGPLLFAIPWTGYQNWPAAGCTGGTGTTTTTTTLPTATSTTTSTTTSTSTTTTVPSGTTTSTTPAGVQGASTTTVPSAVEAATQTPTGTTVPTSGVEAATTTRATVPAAKVAGLAFTGGSVGWLLAMAVVLLVAGTISTLLSRRRR